MTDPLPWWDEHPERLQVEEQELDSLGGTPPVLNEKLLAESAVRQYTVPYTDGHGNVYGLTVTYPDIFPYAEPVVASDHDFGAHREPGHGILCLTRGGSAAWDIGESAAGLILSQMPLLLADRTDMTHPDAFDTNDGASHEADDAKGDGEPALPHVEARAGYYTYDRGSGIRYDGSWSPMGADGGTLLLAADRFRPDGFRGTVLRVLDDDGNVLAEADPEILGSNMYPEPARFAGRWIRVPDPPEGPGVDSVLASAVAADESLSRTEAADLDVLGIVFEDDLGADIASGTVTRGDAWMFVVRPTAKVQPPPVPKAKGKNKKKGSRYTPPAALQSPQLVPGMRSGRDDIFVRVPTLSPMQDRTVALFGAGGLGAPSAVEFAKAGLGVLVGIERDTVDPGNSVRWPYGYEIAGLHKLAVLDLYIRQHWPYTRTEFRGENVGAARVDGGGEPQWETLDRLVAECDLIYDATAEDGVTLYLAMLAERHDVPLVVVSATEGAWGGSVAVVHPSSGGPCWTCHLHYSYDDGIRIARGEEPEYRPPADPAPATRHAWPAGCNDPTFTGTGFDVATIALAGVRLASAVLCSGDDGGHPPPDWNYARHSFRDATRTLPGGAEPFMLAPHPDCKPCQHRRNN